MAKEKNQEYRDIKSLILKECSCCYDAGDYCCFKDEKCIFFTCKKLPRCNWFEQCVLPLSKELQREYAEDRKIAFKSFLPKKR
jgi:hypothetical protein